MYDAYSGEEIEKFYFREWEELKEYLKELCARMFFYKMICYVHNLGYEFDFLIKNISRPLKILSNTTHNIISGVLEDFKNIEFRCSYLLTGYPLRKIGEMINFPKLESDYRTIYPHDIVTEEEKIYCERDCDIVAKYIVDVMMKQYGRLFNIPYTKTGRVRHKLHEYYNKYEDKNCEWDLMPPEDCYKAMCDAFMGGITTSNPLFTNIKLRNVHSYDITSSYPYAMLKEQFPYTIYKAQEVNNDMVNKYKFWLGKIRFKKIQSKYLWQWLSISKLNNYADNSRFFNGKLIYGAWIEITITNIDFEIINDTYDYEEFEVLEFYPLEKYDYLPKPYIETLIDCAETKHKLKLEIETIDENDDRYIDLDRDYLLAKGDFNGIYGMTVQKLVSDDYYIDEDFAWHIKETEYVQNTKKHIKRNFLFGIYVTAYARRNLIKAILKNCPFTFVYCDTDSIKFIGENIFIDTNKRLQAPYINIDCVKDLGIFKYEKTYDEFKTLGAKKYCYKLNGYYHLVVAGLPKVKKQDCSPYGVNSLDDFCIGRNFEKCKLGKKYLYDNVSFNTVELDKRDLKSVDNFDFYYDNDIVTKGGVALYPTSYLLDMTNSDIFTTRRLRNELKDWLECYESQTDIDLKDYILEVV